MIFPFNDHVGICNLTEFKTLINQQNAVHEEPIKIYLEHQCSERSIKFKCAVVRERTRAGEIMHKGFRPFTCVLSSLEKELDKIHPLNSHTKVFVIGKLINLLKFNCVLLSEMANVFFYSRILNCKHVADKRGNEIVIPTGGGSNYQRIEKYFDKKERVPIYIEEQREDTFNFKCAVVRERTKFTRKILHQGFRIFSWNCFTGPTLEQQLEYFFPEMSGMKKLIFFGAYKCLFYFFIFIFSFY